MHDDTETYDSTDLATHEYRECAEDDCGRVARNSTHCSRHTKMAKILDRLETVNAQHLLTLSCAKTAPSHELAEEFVRDAEHLVEWAKTLVGAAQILRSGLRRRRAPMVGAAVGVSAVTR